MKKHLRATVQALIEGDTDKATEELHAYLPNKFRVVLGEAEECDEEDEKKEDMKDKKDGKDDDDKKVEVKREDDDEEDDDYEEMEEKSKKKGKKKMKEGLNKIAGSKEHTPVHKGGADDKEREYKGYRRNEKGEAYHKVPHKDNSEGYGHEKSKAASRKVKADSDSGIHEKKGDAYKDKVHKADNSHSADAKGKSRKGMKSVKGGEATSPDSDGKKENRRTDKAKGYHGKSREGKDLG